MYPDLPSSAHVMAHCTASRHPTLTLGGVEYHCLGSRFFTMGAKSSTWQGSSSTFGQMFSCQTR